MFPLKSMGTTCDLNHWIKLRLNPDHYNSEKEKKEGEVNWWLGQSQNFSTSSLPRFDTQPLQKFSSTALFFFTLRSSSSSVLLLTIIIDNEDYEALTVLLTFFLFFFFWTQSETGQIRKVCLCDFDAVNLKEGHDFHHINQYRSIVS
ncbi:hypothetical protein HanIR_Chr15g0733551 [Helianthus annuus]|nr:hypothetical protein HanIR_Chr15g0733551 [Helianthus annuus]